jgi:hypothetical protein
VLKTFLLVAGGIDEALAGSKKAAGSVQGFAGDIPTNELAVILRRSRRICGCSFATQPTHLPQVEGT